MPELFGNPYILPAIIVVVLLLLLLLVIMMRKRRGASPSVARSTERPTMPEPARAPTLRPEPKPATEPATVPLTPAAEAPIVSAMPPAEMPAAASAALSAPAVAAEALAVTSLTGLRGGMASFDDPLHSVIADILLGWGDLTSEDTKRLEVFRPEKILEEADKTVLPKDHKSGEHARMRLARIKEHAADLQLKATAGDAHTGPTTEAPADAAASVPLETAGLVEVGAGDTIAPGAVAAAADAAAAPAPIDAADVSPVLEATEPSKAAAEASGDGLADEEIAVPPAADPGEPSFWTEEVEGWEASEPQPHEEIPAWPDEEASAGEVQPEKPSESEGLIAPAQTPEDSLSSLHLRIKTADDLMALPAVQRADMLVFLEPAQLSQVFVATDDPDLKKAVIDTLEHVGNPSALDVLRRCLDDPSPEVQLYALEAADRLLGVG
ncbi:MAG: HEAT repeat domain-containing protein [bacterium]